MKRKRRSYKDLIVWQKAMNVVDYAYSYTDDFPKDELFGLTSQMRRASSSIASNIAEGALRSTNKDFIHFLHVSFSSGAELETQSEIARRRKYGDIEKRNQLENELTEVMKMLNKMTSADPNGNPNAKP